MPAIVGVNDAFRVVPFEIAGAVECDPHHDGDPEIRRQVERGEVQVFLRGFQRQGKRAADHTGIEYEGEDNARLAAANPILQDAGKHGQV